MKQTKKRKSSDSTQKGMHLNTVTPLTNNQTAFFSAFPNYDVVSLTGCPGTGKTYLALYMAFKAMENCNYANVKIIRSAVSTRDMGFLPGNLKEKMAVYESPYVAITTELYGRGDAYEILKQKGMVEFLSSSYMRGTTFSDCVVIIDEAQNMSYHELKTLLTRFGENCKYVLCGDIKQDDLTNPRYKEESGYGRILQVLEKVPSFRNITFDINDIVRSGFCREFIIAEMESTVDDIAERLCISKL